MTAADDHSRELLEEMQRQFRLLAESRTKTEGITATATAKDRSVAVEASADGHIVAVEILTTKHFDPVKLGRSITVCANHALKAAQDAAEKQMVTFFEAQGAVIDDVNQRTGVDLSEAVDRERRPPAIPDHFLSDEAYRQNREQRS